MRWLISFLAAGVAVIAQVTIVDRITFPGGTGPDLVLLAVAALALAGGPMLGSLVGFSAGLALDVAPPGSHFVGQDALVFCLIGYLCGLAAENPASEGVPEQGHTALFEIVVTAVGAVCGEALMALLGVMLSDPRVTWSAIKHVLPVAAGYDVVLAPFALYAAAAVLRLAGTRRESRQAAFSGLPAAGAIAGATQGALRQVPGGSPTEAAAAAASKRALGPSPRSAPMREPDLKLGNLRGQSAALRPSPKSAPMREPNLKLGNLRGQSAALRPAPKSAPMREPNLKLGNLRGQSAALQALAQVGAHARAEPQAGQPARPERRPQTQAQARAEPAAGARRNAGRQRTRRGVRGPGRRGRRRAGRPGPGPVQFPVAGGSAGRFPARRLPGRQSPNAQLPVRQHADGPVAARRIGVQPFPVRAGSAGQGQPAIVTRPVRVPRPAAPGVVLDRPLVRARPLVLTQPVLVHRPPVFLAPRGEADAVVAGRVGRGARAPVLPGQHARPADRRAARPRPAQAGRYPAEPRPVDPGERGPGEFGPGQAGQAEAAWPWLAAPLRSLSRRAVRRRAGTQHTAPADRVHRIRVVVPSAPAAHAPRAD